MNANVKPPVRREAMRIAGKLVSTDDMVEVRNPYDNSVVGLVPAAPPAWAPSCRWRDRPP